MLFGDLVAFTTLSESRDPEEVRELLSEYFAVARTVVGRYGGTIEKFIGDAVMAVWGVPVSHEDDAERAVRAGLDLVAEVAALGDAVGAPGLSMRVGITTGSVAVTLGAVNEGMVAGDAVNTAARVQTAAAPGTVWVDQETRGLTAAAVAFSDMGEHAMKGKAEPARLFRADADRRRGRWRPAGRRARGADDRPRRGAAPGQGAVPRHRRPTARPGSPWSPAWPGSARAGWAGSSRSTSTASPTACAGTAGAACPTATASRSGRSPRWSARGWGSLEGDDRRARSRPASAEGVAKFAADADEAAWLAPRVAALLGGGDGTVFDRTDLFAAWTTFLERVGP